MYKDLSAHLDCVNNFDCMLQSHNEINIFISLNNNKSLSREVWRLGTESSEVVVVTYYDNNSFRIKFVKCQCNSSVPDIFGKEF